MAAGDQDAAYQMAEIITVNKLITADYLKENPGWRLWTCWTLCSLPEDRTRTGNGTSAGSAATFRRTRPGMLVIFFTICGS